MCGIQILDVTYYRQSGAGGDVEAAARKREEEAAKFKTECDDEAAKRACAPRHLRVSAAHARALAWLLEHAWLM
jgi:hypothetical protein